MSSSPLANSTLVLKSSRRIRAIVATNSLGGRYTNTTSTESGTKQSRMAYATMTNQNPMRVVLMLSFAPRYSATFFAAGGLLFR